MICRRPGPSTGRSRRALWLAWTLALANLATCWLAMAAFGGSALAGKELDGLYFVGHRREYRQVSEAVFRYLQVHQVMALLHFVATLAWTVWPAWHGGRPAAGAGPADASHPADPAAAAPARKRERRPRKPRRC